ncbi:hypothetical protein B484DRAFT_423251, partial [Ochromonadaceae sp. CCMP2298]
MAKRADAFDVDFGGGSGGGRPRSRPPMGGSASPNTVRARPIGPSGPPSFSRSLKTFAEGQQVKIKKGTGLPGYFDGKILSKNSDGSYDIEFSDGRYERRVQARRILDPQDFSSPADAKADSKSDARDDSGSAIRFGSKVEVMTRTSARWTPGIVVAVNADKTFDVNLENGRDERGVHASEVRLLPSAGTRSRFEAGTSSTGMATGGMRPRRGGSPPLPSKSTLTSAGSDGEAPVRFRMGQQVEARQGGGIQFLPARVVSSRADGTYDLSYKDGKQESGVQARFIRAASSSALRTSSSSVRSSSQESKGEDKPAMAEGDKVEGNYRGKGRWYPGRIVRENRDGTFDVDYDDGEKETGVEPALLRGLPGASAKSRPVEGAKVEGNFRGKGRWYLGRISKENRDGTFGIDYDDGEMEARVEEVNIRVLGGGFGGLARSPKKENRLAEGTKVEGNYRGRGRWYPGQITRENRDGTFDVD